ncbi:MAG: deoxynucleoside kinase [Chloroflexota bacterium]|nr:deoxynucleoside kinase [Chloroflexota bacterium]
MTETTATKRFIAIAGNVGVGKSTLTELLSRSLGWQPFPEAVDENPYLSDFYKDMRHWSFHSQIFFLSRRLRHHRQLLDHPTSVVQDRSVYEDAEIFALNLFNQAHMDARDYRSYRELYEVLTSFLPPPDLVVYLQATVDTLLRRIRRRGRDYEQDIRPEYLTQLNELYESWIDSFDMCPVLTVPADDLNWVDNGEHLELVIKKIQEKLSGKEIVVFD